MKFHHFGPPGNIFLATSGKIHYCPSSGKNLSDAQGRTQGGFGVEPPHLELDILQKLYYLHKGD